MLNKNLLKIEKENAFSKTTRLIKEYRDNNPSANIISLGIGDVSKPIVKPIVDAMKKACDELSDMNSFKGYGLYYGYIPLKEKILQEDYKDFNFSLDELFISDGTKSDSTNILELFDSNSKILLANPCYPIYLNGALSYSRNYYFGECDDNYKMIVPNEKYDIIYICSPNNPVGNAYSYDELKKWIDYANKNNSVIIYDNVYRYFRESKDVPDSIYEIAGAKLCAIEMRSFSKQASFTGVRCSYFVLPKELGEDINYLWKERTINRFNGASYISQCGALASYSKEAQELIKENIKAYKDNGAYLKKELTDIGFDVIGGIDSPYLWVATPDNLDSWDAFNLFLRELNIIVVPGIIFGDTGKNRIRISALGNKENSVIAIERIKKYYEKKNI